MNILITGGSGGLGKAVVENLAQDLNNTVFFTYSSSLDQAIELENKYSNTRKLHCDFSDQTSVTLFIQSIETLQLDALVNNAATKFSQAHAHKIDTAELITSFQTNVISTIKITQQVLLKFRKQKSGKIITILSSAILSTPPTGWAEYIANKNYLLAMSRSWAIENIRFNITSNCISPSFMQTDFNSELDERMVEGMVSGHPLKRALSVEEVVPVVSFLLSASPFLNGQNIVLNAGEVL